MTTYRKSYIGETHYWTLKSKMAEIRHLKNWHDVIFFCRGWFDLDKITQTGVEWHVDCGNMAKIETRCRIPVWRTFGRIQWHVIPEPPATLQGAATWRIRCHDPRATSHIAGCCRRANSTACPPRATYVSHCRVLPLGEFTVTIPEPHATLQGAVTWRNQCCDPATLQGVRIPSVILKIVFRHILFIFWFLMQFKLWQAAAFVPSPIHLFSKHFCTFCTLCNVSLGYVMK